MFWKGIKSRKVYIIERTNINKMEEKLIEALEQAGLSKNESQVYLALLRLGPSKVTELAKYTNIHRTNVYDSLNHLVKKSLVSYYMEGEVKVFEASDPENLILLIKEKETAIQQILPQLKLNKELAAKSSAHIYEGITAPKRALDRFLTYKEDYYGWGTPKEVPDLIHSFLENWHLRRKKAGIHEYIMYNEEGKERAKYLKKKPLCHVKVLPKELSSPVSTNVIGDEVVFCIWDENPLTIEIKNKRFADAYKKYFKLLWKIAKDV